MVRINKRGNAIPNKPMFSEDERYDYLIKAIMKEIRARYAGKSAPSLREQLADL